MELLASSLLFGATTGVMYAVAGAGMVVIYRQSRIINFAHGDIAAAALFVGYGFVEAGAPYWLVAISVLVTATVIGAAIGFGIIGPLVRKRTTLEVGLVTIALALMIQGLETMFVGGAAKAFPSVNHDIAVRLGSLNVTGADVAALAVGLGAFLLLGALFRFTDIGVAMRAISDNGDTADLLGVPAGLLRTLSWGLGGLLAGVSGLFVAPLYSLEPTSIDALVVFGFIAIVVGGFDSTLGALVAGVLVGVGSSLVAAYLTSTIVAPMLFVCMLIALTSRPYGLFGRRPVERV